MLKSILGTKVGMTQIFNESGSIIPVTVISAGPCVVADIKTKERDGYTAVQLGFGDVKEKSLSKPLLGQYKKKNITPKKHLHEIRLGDAAGLQVGQEIKADLFKAGEYVDVTGVTIGRGYAGTVKRHNFRGGPSTHGQSDRQRAPGSIGCQGFQRVIKGLRMAGHLGSDTVTIQKIKVVSVDPVQNTMVLRGAVPGNKHSLLIINKSVKKIKIAVAQKTKDKKGAKPKEEKKEEKKK